jgi:MFS family permease
MTHDHGATPESRSPAVQRRNYLLYAAEGSLFTTSSAFINPQTVLPALVVGLGGDSIAVGILSIFVFFGLYLPQLFSARIIETIALRKRWTLIAGLVHRVLALGMGASVLFLGGRNPAAGRWLLIAFFGMTQLAMGFSTTGWYDMFAKLVKPSSRGRLIGIRTFFGSGGAFLCGLLLTWFLVTFPFPYNYGIGMVCAFVLQMGSWGCQTALIEDIPSHTLPRRSLIQYFSQMAPILRSDHAFRRFLLAAALLTLAAMPIGFFTVHALREFHTDASMVGEFTLIVVVSQMMSALVSGYIADHFGNKRVIVIGATALMLASTTAYCAPSLPLFRLVFVFLGIHLGTESSARYNIALEFGTPHRRSTYIGLMNTLVAPFYLSGLVGGLVGAWLGFRGVFALALLFSAAGLVFLGFLVSDPRRQPAR